MRSHRLPPLPSLNAATRTLDAMRRRGIEVVDLTESNPTRVGLYYPPDLLAPLASPDGLVYDPHPLGLAAAREAVSADFARRGLAVPTSHIALTASTSEAYALLFKLVCDAGDSVLVPRPGYPLFEHLTLLESVEPRAYPLEYHGSWRIDVERLRALIDDRTRAVVLVSPNNPTGSFVHRDDLDAVVSLAARRELLVIGDEVFADYPLEMPPDAGSMLSRAAAARSDASGGAVCCSLGGLSKSVGLPQLKLAWIACSGPARQVDELLAGYEIVADTYLSVSTPVQTALPHLLTRGADIRRQIRERIARNLAALRAAVHSSPAISLPAVEGGWSAVVQVPASRSEDALVLELLTADHVRVHPGYFFDFEREAFVVVSLLVEPGAFDRGVERLVARASARP